MRVTFYRAIVCIAVFLVCLLALKYPRLDAVVIAFVITWIFEPAFTEKNPNT